MGELDRRETECRNYWRAHSEIRQAVEEGWSTDIIEHSLDEISAIALHTEQPALRARCLSVLTEHRAAYLSAG